MAERPDPAYEAVRRLLDDEWNVMDSTDPEFGADVALLIKAVRDNPPADPERDHPLDGKLEPEAKEGRGSMMEAATVSIAVSLKRLADAMEPVEITGTAQDIVITPPVDGPCPDCHDEGGGPDGALTCPTCGKGVD